MQTKAFTPWLFAWLALASAAPVLAAQDGPPRRYVEFDVNPDYQAVLKNRLQMDKQLGPFKDLIKKIMADPSKMPARPEDLKGLHLDDEKFKKALKDWIEGDPQLKDALKDWAKNQADKKQPADVEKLKDNLNNLLKDPPGGQPKQIDGPNGGGPQVKPGDAKKADPDAWAKMTERAMKQAETTRLGEWLRESPAWRRAFTDLRASIKPDDVARWRAWQEQLKLPDGKIGEFGEGTLNRLRNLPRPNLENWRMPAGLGGLSMPNVAGPALPGFSGPSLPSISAGATWILLLLVVLMAGWQLMRWHQRRTAPGGAARVPIGPCPVQLDAIATRAELIRAFDYLAMLTLGLDVKCWNHHAIAMSWREQAPACAPSANALAAIYELARYTDGDDALTSAERDQARQSIAQIAGAL